MFSRLQELDPMDYSLDFKLAEIHDMRWMAHAASGTSAYIFFEI